MNIISCKHRVVFPVGGKGGVGKTWTMLLLLQWIESLGVRFRALDCDDENSSLSRFYSEAEFVEIRDQFAIDKLVQTAVDGNVAVTLVDLPARCSEEFEQWLGVVPWEELAATGMKFTAIGVLEQSKDSLASVMHWHEFLGQHVDYVIALNRKTDDGGLYLGSKARKELQKQGVVEIEVPKLDDRLVRELERTNVSIAGALASKEASELTQVMNRSRLRRYLSTAFAEFEKGRSVLIP